MADAPTEMAWSAVAQARQPTMHVSYECFRCNAVHLSKNDFDQDLCHNCNAADPSSAHSLSGIGIFSNAKLAQVKAAQKLVDGVSSDSKNANSTQKLLHVLVEVAKSIPDSQAIVVVLPKPGPGPSVTGKLLMPKTFAFGSSLEILVRCGLVQTLAALVSAPGAAGDALRNALQLIGGQRNMSDVDKAARAMALLCGVHPDGDVVGVQSSTLSPDAGDVDMTTDMEPDQPSAGDPDAVSGAGTGGLLGVGVLSSSVHPHAVDVTMTTAVGPAPTEVVVSHLTAAVPSKRSLLSAIAATGVSLSGTVSTSKSTVGRAPKAATRGAAALDAQRLLAEKLATLGLVGLQNPVNSCYVNSVLQMLFGLPLVVHAIEDAVRDKCACGGGDLCLAAGLHQTFTGMKAAAASGKTSILPASFLNNVLPTLPKSDGGFFSPKYQADPTDLFQAVCARLHAKCGNPLKGLVDFDIESQVKCGSCGGITCRTDLMYVLLVPLTGVAVGVPFYKNLHDAVASGFGLSSVVGSQVNGRGYECPGPCNGGDKDSAWYHTHPDKLTRASTSHTIVRFPQYLVVLLQRWELRNGNVVKLLHNMRCDETVDLTPVSRLSATCVTAANEAGRDLGSLQMDADPFHNEHLQFTAGSVVFHKGASFGSGHITMAVKTATGWVDVDDASVVIHQKGQGPGASFSNHQAYMVVLLPRHPSIVQAISDVASAQRSAADQPPLHRALSGFAADDDDRSVVSVPDSVVGAAAAADDGSGVMLPNAASSVLEAICLVRDVLVAAPRLPPHNPQDLLLTQFAAENIKLVRDFLGVIASGSLARSVVAVQIKLRSCVVGRLSVAEIATLLTDSWVHGDVLEVFGTLLQVALNDQHDKEPCWRILSLALSSSLFDHEGAGAFKVADGVPVQERAARLDTAGVPGCQDVGDGDDDYVADGFSRSKRKRVVRTLSPVAAKRRRVVRKLSPVAASGLLDVYINRNVPLAPMLKRKPVRVQDVNMKSGQPESYTGDIFSGLGVIIPYTFKLTPGAEAWPFRPSSKPEITQMKTGTRRVFHYVVVKVVFEKEATSAELLTGRLEYADSLPGASSEAQKQIVLLQVKLFLQEAWSCLHHDHTCPPSFMTWPVEYLHDTRPGFPVQDMGSNDCGPMACMFMEFMSRGVVPTTADLEKLGEQPGACLRERLAAAVLYQTLP